MSLEPSNLAQPPRVSVITTFLNAQPFIAEAIESVLAQTFSSFELILVDDGSTDASSAIALDYADRHPGRIRYTDHALHANLGMSASRNAGISIARGELIAFIDADDVWLANKLLDQVSVLDAHPTVGLVAGATLYWGSWEGGADRTVRVGHVQDRIIEPPQALLSLYPLGVAEAPCPSCLMVRRSVVEAVGGFESSYVGRLQMYEDQAFLTKVYLRAPVYFSHQTWFRYRQHDASCVAETIKEGQYHAVRRHFLTWFKGHLRDAAITDPRIERRLRLAQWPYRHPIGHRVFEVFLTGVRAAWRRFKGSLVRRRASNP